MSVQKQPMVDTEDHLDQENTQNVQSKHEHKDSHCSSLPERKQS